MATMIISVTAQIRLLPVLFSSDILFSCKYLVSFRVL